MYNLLGVENEREKTKLGGHVEEQFGHYHKGESSIEEKPERIEGSPASAPQLHRFQWRLRLSFPCEFESYGGRSCYNQSANQDLPLKPVPEDGSFYFIPHLSTLSDQMTKSDEILSGFWVCG